jgi:hypothetical protein
MFPALRSRNFRLLWLGLLVSFSGSFMQSAAVLWHVSILVEDDRRALALGLVGLVRVVPIVLCSLISGVLTSAFMIGAVNWIERRGLVLIASCGVTYLWRGRMPDRYCMARPVDAG